MTQLGINILLKFLPRDMQKNINKMLVPSLQVKYPIQHKKADAIELLRVTNEMVEGLGRNNDIKIFIGRDAYFLYQKYVEKFPTRSDSYFMMYTRRYLFGAANNWGYFKIIGYIYRQNLTSLTFPIFLANFKKNIQSDQRFYKMISKKTIGLLQKIDILTKIIRLRRVTIIDSGTQGGLILPLLVVLKDLGVYVDFRMIACFSWLKNIYKNKIITDDLTLLILLEKISVQTYQDRHRIGSD